MVTKPVVTYADSSRKANGEGELILPPSQGRCLEVLSSSQIPTPSSFAWQYTWQGAGIPEPLAVKQTAASG
ncbi:hypothetical protein [Synechococcus sp. H70.2]|uniref:hypothetical protein n=1 Tax=Synechococcus sp. H70.2 TaxID=2964528 RepID=UPI0039C24394